MSSMMKPVKPTVRLARNGRLTVAVAEDDLAPMTEQEVLETRLELARSYQEDAEQSRHLYLEWSVADADIPKAAMATQLGFKKKP